MGKAGREAMGVKCGQVSLEKVLKYFARQFENPKGHSKSSSSLLELLLTWLECIETANCFDINFCFIYSEG